VNIAFRVDASSQIGTGHFMRCLTLADALQQHGMHTRFVCRHLPGYLRDILAAKNHQLVMLASEIAQVETDGLAHSSWLGVSQTQDAADSLQALIGQHCDWLVVDHYALDARWEGVLRPVVKKILVIDDIADRQHDCDVLLDQNFYADMHTRYTGKVPDYCALLLGPRYALLREEFSQFREQVKLRTGPVQRILIFFGGVDANNHTGRAINALARIGIEGLQVDVVIGAQHPCRNEIVLACAENKFTCHVQTDRMAELMTAADLAIGAGGSASWERCCLGLPTLAICTANNQRNQLIDAASAGLLYSPEINSEVDLAIERHVRSLLENSSLRQLISGNGLQAVDGRGISRVIGSMRCGGLEMRIANVADSEHLFAWRNHPTIRAVSRTTNPINWEDHSHWFASVLSDSDRQLLIAERDGLPVGVVRFDIQNSEAEISIYLVPDTNTLVRGRDLLQNAENWLAQHYPQVKILHAHVLGTNARSNQLFQAAGYQFETSIYFKRLH